MKFTKPTLGEFIFFVSFVSALIVRDKISIGMLIPTVVYLGFEKFFFTQGANEARDEILKEHAKKIVSLELKLDSAKADLASVEKMKKMMSEMQLAAAFTPRSRRKEPSIT